MKFILVFIASLCVGCMSQPTQHFIVDHTQTFELVNGYGVDEHVTVISNGKKFERGVHLCKGIYRSTFRDDFGVYFAAENHCHLEIFKNGGSGFSTSEGGIWVPNNKDKKQYQYWLRVGPSDTKNEFVQYMEKIEVGNYKKMGIYLDSDKVIEEIEKTLKIVEQVK